MAFIDRYAKLSRALSNANRVLNSAILGRPVGAYDSKHGLDVGALREALEAALAALPDEGEDASEELNELEREFATKDRKARDVSSANIGAGPSNSKNGAGPRREIDHREDFAPNRGTTADSRFGFSRGASLNIDAIWPSGSA